MEIATNKGIPLSSINPRYLHTNSTSHIWPFSAIAELIDNAYDPDVNAKQFWIDKTVLKDQDCLIFMDNGKGMDYAKMHKMLSFGFSDKQTVKGHVPVGLYGNGFKSGSMRLGKDAIVFSKKADTMCVGLLSQTYLEKIKAEHVQVPIVMFTSSEETVSVKPEYEECLHDILTHSLFNTMEELLSEFSVIEGLCTKSCKGTGTRIIIWNIRRTSSGKLEFDFEKDRYDIQIPVYERTNEKNKHQSESCISLPESEYSLRAYSSIMYLKPRMQIILRGMKVESQFVTKTLANVLKDTYKPALKPPLSKGITITFGYNTKSKEHFGLMMYHKNRLIKAYERVACQRKAKSTAVGVIGVMECNYLIPTHNKQDFDNTDEYRKTMQNVGSKLEDYWKEIRYRRKQILNCNEPVEDTVEQPDQNWVQCDDCMKWRKLPDCIDMKKLPKKWFCRMNSDPQYRSCEVEEEPEDCDGEQKYQKTYKQDEKYQEEGEKTNKEQSTSSPNPSCPTTTSSDLIPSPGSRPDSSSVGTKDTRLSSTPTRRKRALDPNQQNSNNKKARGKGLSDTPSTSTASSDAHVIAAVSLPESGANKASNDVTDKSIVLEQSNKIPYTSSEDLQISDVQKLQTVEQVDSLEDKKCSLLTCCEQLQKCLEEIKKEKKNMTVSVKEQGIQTHVPISYHEESAEINNPQTCRLREVRQRVANLLKTILPELELENVNYDSEVMRFSLRL